MQGHFLSVFKIPLATPGTSASCKDLGFIDSKDIKIQIFYIFLVTDGKVRLTMNTSLNSKEKINTKSIKKNKNNMNHVKISTFEVHPYFRLSSVKLKKKRNGDFLHLNI